MPEGPSLVIVKENYIYTNLGETFIYLFKRYNIEIHFRVFDNYLNNKRKPKINAKLNLQFAKEELNFYVFDVNLLKDISIYDKETDIMSEEWNATKEIKN